MTEAAREWQNHNRDESYLYIGSRLDVAREWSEAHAPDVNPLEREFLHASLALRRRGESAELEAARRLAEEAESRRQAEENRAREAELREREAKLGEQEQTASALRLRRRAWLFLPSRSRPSSSRPSPLQAGMRPRNGLESRKNNRKTRNQAI